MERKCFPTSHATMFHVRTPVSCVRCSRSRRVSVSPSPPSPVKPCFLVFFVRTCYPSAATLPGRVRSCAVHTKSTV